MVYKGCFSSLTKKILILTNYVGGMKALVHISQSARPTMTVLHYANGKCREKCMYSIVFGVGVLKYHLINCEL